MKVFGLCLTSAWLKTWRGWICPISPVASGRGLKGKIQKRDSLVAMITVMQDAFALETRCPAPAPSRLCYYRKSKRESLSVPLRLLSFCSSGNRSIGISEVIEWMQWMLVLIHLDRHHHRYSPKCREGSNGVSAAPRSVQKPGSLAILILLS